MCWRTLYSVSALIQGLLALETVILEQTVNTHYLRPTLLSRYATDTEHVSPQSPRSVTIWGPESPSIYSTTRTTLSVPKYAMTWKKPYAHLNSLGLQCYNCSSALHNSGSQMVVPRPPAPMFPGNALEMQILRPHAWATE